LGKTTVLQKGGFSLLTTPEKIATINVQKLRKRFRYRYRKRFNEKFLHFGQKKQKEADP